MSNYTAKFLINEPEGLEKIGRITAKIAFYNFDWRYVTLVIFTTLQYTIALESFLGNYKQSVIVKFGKFIPHHRYAVPQYIVFGQDATAITKMIKWLNKSHYDTSGKYIFICTSPQPEICDEAQIFEALTKVFIVNVIYLRASSRDDFVSFTYDIVLPGICINSVAYALNITDDCPYDDCLKQLYPEKLKNFHTCPIIISTFEQPPFMHLSNNNTEVSGGDGDIIKLLTSVLNATLLIKTAEGNNWGQYENNNWTGSLGDVFNDRVHISVCSLPVTASRYGNFQISFIYNSMDIVWIAELPPNKPVWQKLLTPFRMRARVALFIIFVGIVFINAFLKSKIWTKFRRGVNASPLQSNLLFYSWASFVGIPLLRMPTKPAFLLIVYSWIWFCFVMRSSYQGGLINSLKNELYEGFYTDFLDVLKGRNSYGGLETLREYYADDSHIYDNWITLNYDDTTKTLERISNTTSSFVLAINKEIVIEHLIEYNGLRQLQIIPEKIVNSPTVMYFKKHSVLTQPFNHVLSLAVEAGFTQLTYTRFVSRKKILFQRLTKHRTEALTFDNFKACMFLLTFGWSLSIIFFAVEMFCGRLEDD